MTYTVKPGDSISKIARDVLGDMSLWREIARINNLSNPNLIHPGQVLVLPARQSMIPPQASQSVPANIMPQTATASLGGWVVGGFLLLLIAGTAYQNSKDKKQGK